MKTNFEILFEYFEKQYNLKRKKDKYKYVADELGVHPRTIWNIMNNKYPPSKVLSILADKVVKDFRMSGRIR